MLLVGKNILAGCLETVMFQGGPQLQHAPGFLIYKLNN